MCVYIGLGNRLLPDGSQPLHESMLTDHQPGPFDIHLMACWQIHRKWSKMSITKICFKITYLKIKATCLSAQWVKTNSVLKHFTNIDKVHVNTSDAGNRIFQLWAVGSIPCLLIRWLLKSPGHQRAWYWLCRTDNMYCCSRVNLIYSSQAKSEIQNTICLVYCLKTIQHVKS